MVFSIFGGDKGEGCFLTFHRRKAEWEGSGNCSQQPVADIVTSVVV